MEKIISKFYFCVVLGRFVAHAASWFEVHFIMKLIQIGLKSASSVFLAQHKLELILQNSSAVSSC